MTLKLHNSIPKDPYTKQLCEELSGLKDVMNKTFLVAVDTRFKVGRNLCCLCVESFLKMK